MLLAILIAFLATSISGVRAADTNIVGTGALPVLVFQTDGKAVQDRSRVPASLTVLLPEDGGSKFSIDETGSGPAELSVRGNSSFDFPKKSYRLELQDTAGKDRKASLLDLPADSDWVLYGSVTDRTFTRNLLGHELWRSTGRYAVRWRFVEVFVLTNALPDRIKPDRLSAALPYVLKALETTNSAAGSTVFSNANDRMAIRFSEGYVGLYVLMEKIKRGKERLNIARIRPDHADVPEITGGYIIKKDDLGRGEKGLLTGQELKLRFEEPREKDLTTAQREWMTTYLNQFEKALFGRKFRDPAEGYARFLDLDSFADFHWMVEVAKNADGYWFSQYMHKDRGGTLTMGPVWDWDNSFANPNFRDTWYTNGWRFEIAQDPDYTWYRRLFEDPDFLQRYSDRWETLKTNTFNPVSVHSLIDHIVSQWQVAKRRNENRWPFYRYNRFQTNMTVDAVSDDLRSLKQWVRDRVDWIDSQKYPKPVLQMTGSTGEVTIAMAWLEGRLFYTTNGIDPRIPGGGVSPVALEYSKPVAVRTPMNIKARTRSQFGLWSAPVVLNVGSSGTNSVVERREGR